MEVDVALINAADSMLPVAEGPALLCVRRNKRSHAIASVALDGGGYVGVSTADGGTTSFLAPAPGYALTSRGAGSIEGHLYDPEAAQPGLRRSIRT